MNDRMCERRIEAGAPALRRIGSAALVSGLSFMGAALLAAPIALAQSTLAASPDVTIAVGGAGLVVQDEDVVVDNQLGIVVLENLGSLPDAAEVTGHAVDANGDRLFSLETTTSLAGGIVARPGDVVRYDGASYSLEFDASTAGVPDGVAVDAVSLAPGGLSLSFDTTVALGGGIVAADEDVVRWDGADFSMVFDGSAAGLGASLDVDGTTDLGGGAFMVSLDTSGVVGGVNFDDEDVLRYDGAGWTLEFDASDADADWRAADLDAVQVPEPGVAWALGLGSLALFSQGIRRATRR